MSAIHLTGPRRRRTLQFSSPQETALDAPSPPSGALDTVRAILAREAARPGPLLPVLHAVQDVLGHIPPGVVGEIAQALHLSRAEVHGVISHYPHFRQQPPGRHRVQVCQAEACKACGADALMAQAERLLRCAPHATRADGAVTLEPVYCLGLCAMSPAIAINERPLARVTPGRLQAIVATLEGAA